VDRRFTSAALRWALPPALACVLGQGCRAPTGLPSATQAPSLREDAAIHVSGERAGRPAILFASPTGADAIDLDYLRELVAAGFEVDYTNGLEELTAERLRPFNAIVLFATPDAIEVSDKGHPSDPHRVQSFADLVEGYLGRGGGVLLMPGETNVRKQRLGDLTDRWGAQLPAEQIIEQDTNDVAPMPHSGRATKLAFTDRITVSPITDGVRGLWYPFDVVYHGALTGPLVVSDLWQVVVRASKTAITRPIQFGGDVTAPLGIVRRSQAEQSPAIVAIRTLSSGRIALIAEWPQFSVGAGTKWIYDRDVLDRGLAGRTSDFGRLLSNTFAWLAEPSRARGELGGWTTLPDRLRGPNAGDEVRAQYRSQPPSYDASTLGRVDAPSDTLYRGLIGAKSAYSSGRGSVADYAAAARRAKLDFVVFLEDFDRMSKDKLAALTADCTHNSGPDLLLLPGFSIVSNVGNRLFFFSPNPQWPPDDVLTGSRKNILYIQEQNATGAFTGNRTAFLPWVLDAYLTEKGQIGYYDFADAPHGMRLHDARLYAMVGLRYYRDGRLVEDLLDEYLTTVASTSPPAPASVDEVSSPEQLVEEARSSHSMTYAQASGRGGIFQGALRWSHQYDAMPVSVSSGPKIISWKGCNGVRTYGAEGFSPERSAMEAPLSIASDAGLEEVRIYDGQRLFRRFLPGGAKTFQQKLIVDDSVQRNLVVVARDRRGGEAVSFPRRNWADGSMAPIFCSDHINDCGPMRLAHGPYWLPLSDPPSLPLAVAGWTWDGGPVALSSAVGFQETLPEVTTANNVVSARRLDQIPLLDFSDEGAVGVESIRLESYDARLLEVVDPWNTYGPLGGPAPLFENTQSYREWIAATTGAPPTGWAVTGVRTGSTASLLRDVMRFRGTAVATSISFAHLHRPADTTIVVGHVKTGTIASQSVGSSQEIRLDQGDWFAVYGNGLSNAHLFENRGSVLRIQTSATIDIAADLHDQTFHAGDEYVFELAASAFPIDRPIATSEQVARYAAYLGEPAGLLLLRGKRRASPGLLEVVVDAGAVELSIPKSQGVDGLTLPARISGLNPRWSAGLLQEDGYSPGFYGTGHDRFRSVAVDAEGSAYVPMYVDRADVTRILAGHPVAADQSGNDLFIDVTCIGGTPPRWHVSVNNPDDHPIATTLKQAMALPGLSFLTRKVTVPAGGYVVLQ
jgi:hypothetical protein